MLIDKYLGTDSIFLVTPKGNCSYVWQGILKTVAKLRGRFKFRFGSRETSMWYDHWISQNKLCHLVNYVHISDTMLKVKDIWEDGKWAIQKLAKLLMI